MYYETNYLAHYGVKGMKWGVRHDPERKGRSTRNDKKIERYNKKLDSVNEKLIYQKALGSIASRRDDPTSFMALPTIDRKINRYSEEGHKIVEKMKKKGLVSSNTSFKDYSDKYEKKVFNDCKKYISDAYGIEDPSDDVAAYFFDTYLFGVRNKS